MKAAGQYVIVRTHSGRCFAGELIERKGKEATLTDVRHLAEIAGADNLSDLAVRGTYLPMRCNFRIVVPTVLLTSAVEIFVCTQKARLSIESVPGSEDPDE
jgi:hypothetical protein